MPRRIVFGHADFQPRLPIVVDIRLLDARRQVALGFSPFYVSAFPDGTPWVEFFRNPSGYLLRFPGLADFQVTADVRSVSCHPVPGVSDETSRHLYLNQVLPMVLSKLGKLVFHASAVEVGDVAVAFVAESGRGKSTLAASFATGGFRFLTDDGLVLEEAGDAYVVLPSHPSIRLWDDSKEALVFAGTETAPPLCFTTKSRFLAGPGLSFCEESRPLRRVYFLGDGSASKLEFQRINATQALMEWIKHSFLLDVEEQPLLASHFDRTAKLANQPIYYHLDYPRRFEDLANVRQAIVEHALQESQE
jgi:hypothetical protein